MDKEIDQREYEQGKLHIRACYLLQGQGSICVQITGPEKKIIISLRGEKRAPQPNTLIYKEAIKYLKSKEASQSAHW